MGNPVKTLSAYPFRLFFLLVGVYGVLVVLAWVLFLFAGLPLPLGWSPLHWHSHEMLFGLIGAAIAGFILTAVCNWTGEPPLVGGRLILLGGAWLIGRIAFWLAGWLPLWLVAFMDMLFLPALGIILMRVLLAHDNRRNLLLAAIILLLALANLFMHIGFIAGGSRWLMRGELLALNLITLMMTVIGGRIIPLFTGNWLRNQNIATHAHPVVRSWLDKACLLSTALLIPVDMLGSTWLTSSVALSAAFFNAWRLMDWKGWNCWREPLLWVLHIGYAWLVIALLMKGLAGLGLISVSAGLHALGTGAMATLVLGIMTRVALGHTGRSLKLPKYGLLIYVFVCAAALLRVMAALGWIEYRNGLVVAALAWCIAFGLFVLLYWPILSRPRQDGRPG